MKFLAFLWIFEGYLFFQFQTDAVTVSTQYGSLLGSTVSYPNASGPVKSVHRFLGVPYASPPSGELRFKAPEPPKPWKPSTYDARYYRNVCIQMDYFYKYIQAMWPSFTRANYSEDCLYLNVFTPGKIADSGAVFPVMVYIHGGGYNIGTPVLNPSDQIALHGVVVVAFQYRLGPFGFLSTGDSAAPGNFGMLDQVQALKWVKENIEAFGGDKNKVTIFGLSAGSSSVNLQLLSPLSKGLFHRAISESGVDLTPWAIHKTSNALFYTRFVAEKLGCGGARDSESTVECLRSKPATGLNMAGVEALMLNKYVDEIAWSPVVDGQFLLDTPQAIRKAGTFHKVEYMAGFTSDEGSIFLSMTVNTSNIDPVTFKRYFGTYSRGRVLDTRTATVLSDALEFEYTPWPDASNPALLRQGLVDFMTEHDYAAPTDAVMSAHSAAAPSFMYLFSHRSSHDERPAWMGAQHGDSSGYIFGTPFMNLNASDEADRNVSRFMMNTWTNFAKTGNPTPGPVGGVTWVQFNSSNKAYLDIADGTPRMAKNFRPRRVAFWNWYFPRLLNTKFEGEEPTTGSFAKRVVPLRGTLSTALLIGYFFVGSFCAVTC